MEFEPLLEPLLEPIVEPVAEAVEEAAEPVFEWVSERFPRVGQWAREHFPAHNPARNPFGWFPDPRRRPPGVPDVDWRHQFAKTEPARKKRPFESLTPSTVASTPAETQIVPYIPSSKHMARTAGMTSRYGPRGYGLRRFSKFRRRRKFRPRFRRRRSFGGKRRLFVPTTSRRMRRQRKELIGSRRVASRWGLYYQDYDYNAGILTGPWVNVSIYTEVLGDAPTVYKYTDLYVDFNNIGMATANTGADNPTCGYVWKGFRLVMPYRVPPTVTNFKVEVFLVLYHRDQFQRLGSSNSERLAAVHGQTPEVSGLPFRARPYKGNFMVLAKKTHVHRQSTDANVVIARDGTEETAECAWSKRNRMLILSKCWRKPLYIRQYYVDTAAGINKDLADSSTGGTRWCTGKSRNAVTMAIWFRYREIDTFGLSAEQRGAINGDFEFKTAIFSWLHVDRQDAYKIVP